MYVAILFKKHENLPTSILPEKKYGAKYKSAEKGKETEKLPIIRSLYRSEISSLPTSRYQKIGLQETKRGDAIHDILSNIEFLSEKIEVDVRRAAQQILPGEGIDVEKEIANLVQYLSLPNVKEFFTQQKERTVLREQDIAASNGRLYRMDRVIVDATTITIIDFKTGNDEKNDEYQEQVRNYMMMVSEIYPEKSIVGVLLYIDLRKAVNVQ